MSKGAAEGSIRCGTRRSRFRISGGKRGFRRGIHCFMELWEGPAKFVYMKLNEILSEDSIFQDTSGESESR